MKGGEEKVHRLPVRPTHFSINLEPLLFLKKEKRAFFLKKSFPKWQITHTRTCRHDEPGQKSTRVRMSLFDIMDDFFFF